MWDLNSRISCLNVGYSLGTRLLKIWNFTLKWILKIVYWFFMFHLKLNLFFSLFIAKIEKKVTNTFCILFFRSKTILSIFGERKKYLTNFNFKFYFLYCSLIIKKVCANFQKKILIFKVPLIFWKWKLCCMLARPKLLIFWNWTHKNTPNRQLSVSFQIRKKC